MTVAIGSAKVPAKGHQIPSVFRVQPWNIINMGAHQSMGDLARMVRANFRDLPHDNSSEILNRVTPGTRAKGRREVYLHMGRRSKVVNTRRSIRYVNHMHKQQSRSDKILQATLPQIPPKLVLSLACHDSRPPSYGPCSKILQADHIAP